MRAELRRALAAGEPAEPILESFVGPLVEQAVPEWRNTLELLLEQPEIAGTVGYSGMAAVGIGRAAVEPRITALTLFAGGYVPRAQRIQARQVDIPLLFLLQWDDAGNNRRIALDLFDAFGSREKTLHANVRGHAGTPWFEADDADRFFVRHLVGDRGGQSTAP